jgi:hypothetical protein
MTLFPLMFICNPQQVNRCLCDSTFDIHIFSNLLAILLHFLLKAITSSFTQDESLKSNLWRAFINIMFVCLFLIKNFIMWVSSLLEAFLAISLLWHKEGLHMVDILWIVKNIQYSTWNWSTRVAIIYCCNVTKSLVSRNVSSNVTWKWELLSNVTRCRYQSLLFLLVWNPSTSNSMEGTYPCNISLLWRNNIAGSWEFTC